MQVATTRFSTLAIEDQDTVLFPAGLPGLEDCRQWVLLVEPEGDARDANPVAWLQSTQYPEVALPLVSPRRFVPDYFLTAGREQLERLGLQTWQEADVLAVISRGEQGLILNLKAPLVFNRQRRLGSQVINTADWPISYSLAMEPMEVRRSA
ncbi:MAG: flagellar assembly protein FliW [Planctomycetia bacterium]|nr:flagellar assembly protein FliW [Planctomycetia bacterium]